MATSNTNLSSSDSDVRAFIPENMEIKPDTTRKTGPKRINLAEDEALAKTVMSHLNTQFERYKSHRTEIDEIVKALRDAANCGQNTTVRETERARVDSQGDDKTKTKSQKVGSTLVHRIIRSLASQFTDVLFSRRDPYDLKPRYNGDIYLSDTQAKQLAEQHKLLMRWTRDQENFPVKAVDLFYQLLTDNNVPVFSYWKHAKKEVLDTWPVFGKNEAGDRIVKGVKRERRLITVDNRPDFSTIPYENFFADPAIGDIQKQSSVIVRSLAAWQDFYAGARCGDYLNVGEISRANLYRGGDLEITESQETSEGLDSPVTDSDTGTFLQFDAHAYLPIDETKPKGKRWDSKKHRPKIFWVTVAGRLTGGGICLRIERNLDPHDEMPFEMLNLYPGNENRLYKMGMGQALRGNYEEMCTTKAQMIDTRTINLNRPTVIKGNVKSSDKTYEYRRDQVYSVQDPQAGDGVEWAPELQGGDSMGHMSYLEHDTDEAAGNTRVVRGEPMGGRTSSNEAQKAYNAGSLPNKMLIKYVFAQWFRFRMRKGIAMWHLHAEKDQILKISDYGDVYETIRPSDLYGDFDIDMTLVDDFERDLLTAQGLNNFFSTAWPAFEKVIDARKLVKPVFEQILHISADEYMLPDNREATKTKTRRIMNAILEQGREGLDRPDPSDDLATVLEEAMSFRIQYTGVEDEYPNVKYMDAFIKITEEMLKTQSNQQAPNPKGQENQTEGEVAGNEIAGQLGALA